MSFFMNTSDKIRHIKKKKEMCSCRTGHYIHLSLHCKRNKCLEILIHRIEYY